MRFPRKASALAAGLLLTLTGCDMGALTAVDVPLFKGLPESTRTPGTPQQTTPVQPSGIPVDASGGEAAVRPVAEYHARTHAVPTGLVMAVISQESAFQPNAVSPVGAQGLMQLMPGTVQHINQVGKVSVLDPFDADQNVGGGTWYLTWVRSQVPDAQVAVGDEWKFTLGGYNAGIGRVRAAITKAQQGAPAHPRATWADVAPLLPSETQRYVPSVIAKWDRYGR